MNRSFETMRLNYIYLLILLLSSSCVKELPFNEEDSSIPVVNCVLKNDSIQTLTLTRSIKLSEAYIFKEIKDAEIYLLIGESLVGNFAYASYKNWQLKYVPIPNTEYQLMVKLGNGTELTATTTMPKNLIIYPNFAEDRFPSKNYFQCNAELPCWVSILSSDHVLLYDARPVYGDGFIEEIGTDHPNVDRFNSDGNLVSSIPSADTPSFLFYIRIEADSTINNSSNIPFKLQASYGEHSFVCFRTASLEYDKYLKTSFQKIWMRLDDSDPIIWFDETEVFSNINNGVGIFAAYSDRFYNYNDDGDPAFEK